MKLKRCGIPAGWSLAAILLSACVTTDMATAAEETRSIATPPPPSGSAPSAESAEIVRSFHTPSGEAYLVKGAKGYSISLPDIEQEVPLPQMRRVHGLTTHPMPGAYRQLVLIRGQNDHCDSSHMLVVFGTHDEAVESKEFNGCEESYEVSERFGGKEVIFTSTGLEPVSYFYNGKAIIGPSQAPVINPTRIRRQQEFMEGTR